MKKIFGKPFKRFLSNFTAMAILTSSIFTSSALVFADGANVDYRGDFDGNANPAFNDVVDLLMYIQDKNADTALKNMDEKLLMFYGDVNRDGKLTSLDVSHIIEHILNPNHKFPGEQGEKPDLSDPDKKEKVTVEGSVPAGIDSITFTSDSAIDADIADGKFSVSLVKDTEYTITVTLSDDYKDYTLANTIFGDCTDNSKFTFASSNNINNADFTLTKNNEPPTPEVKTVIIEGSVPVGIDSITFTSDSAIDADIADGKFSVSLVKDTEYTITVTLSDDYKDYTLANTIFGDCTDNSKFTFASSNNINNADFTLTKNNEPPTPEVKTVIIEGSVPVGIDSITFTSDSAIDADIANGKFSVSLVKDAEYTITVTLSDDYKEGYTLANTVFGDCTNNSKFTFTSSDNVNNADFTLIKKDEPPTPEKETAVVSGSAIEGIDSITFTSSGAVEIIVSGSAVDTSEIPNPDNKEIHLFTFKTDDKNDRYFEVELIKGTDYTVTVKLEDETYTLSVKQNSIFEEVSDNKEENIYKYSIHWDNYEKDNYSADFEVKKQSNE